MAKMRNHCSLQLDGMQKNIDEEMLPKDEKQVACHWMSRLKELYLNELYLTCLIYIS